MSIKQEYIAEADRFLVQAGVPTYRDVTAQRDRLVEILQGALAEDLLPYHSNEWIARANAELTAAGAA